MTFYTLEPVDVPARKSWNISPFITLVSEQKVIYNESIHDLGDDIGTTFNTHNIYTHTSIPVVNDIIDGSYPLRTIDAPKSTLVAWELTSRFMDTHMTERVARFLKHAKPRAYRNDKITTGDSFAINAMTLRTFHIADEYSIVTPMAEQLGLIIRKMEVYDGVRIDWTHICQTRVVPDESNGANWIVGQVNISAWSNRVLQGPKLLDLITSSNARSSDTCSILVFALENLAIDGAIVIKLPKITNTPIISILHICAATFTSCTIHHLQADDAIYLCADGFRNNLPIWTHRLIEDLISREQSARGLGLFTRSYCESAIFCKTVQKLALINRSLFEWRYDYYTKIIAIFMQLDKNAIHFDNYVTQVISQHYKDQSRKWILATGWKSTPKHHNRLT